MAWKEILKIKRRKVNLFALALIVPPAVCEYVDNIPGLTESAGRKYESNKEHALLRKTGYIDGKNFQNAGDKERIAN